MSSIGSLFDALRSQLTPSLLPLASPDLQAGMEEAIALAQRKGMRQRKLPPPVTFLFTLFLNVWRSESTFEVFERLRQAWRAIPGATDGALAHARKRLGVAPLRAWFEQLALQGIPRPSLKGLRVWALDGVRFNLPDTPANARRFGRPACPEGGPALPQALLLVLAAVTNRCIGAASIQRCRTGERAPGLELLKRLGSGDLLLIDSGFYSAALIEELVRRGISYIVRLPASVKNLHPLEGRPGWYEIRTRYRPEGRRRRRHGPSRTIHIQGRVVTYRIGREKVRLLTDLPCELLGDAEIIDTYHLRWEIELLADEVKTHLAAPAHGTCPIPLRSKSPELVEQEIYSLLALYNVLRLNMAAAAERAGVPPVQMSFVKCLRVVRRACQAPAPRTPAQARTAARHLLRDLAACTIDRPRRPRQVPRVVRKPSRGFPGKRRHHKTRNISLKSRVRMCQPA